MSKRKRTISDDSESDNENKENTKNYSDEEKV